jgi:tRNA A-37 threonylcarbamoyl transferase component Bud32
VKRFMVEWIAATFGKVYWQVNAAWREALFDEHGLRLAQWRRQEAIETVKDAPHRTIYRVNVDGTTIYVKHYPLPDLRSRLRQLFRPSKACGEFACALAVAARQVETIEPLAVGATPHGESYLITRGLDGAQPLNHFLEYTFPTIPAPERNQLRLRLTERLAQFLAQMHNVGVVHPDLHAGNIMVRPSGPGGPDLYLIDLHAVRLGMPLGWGQSCRNLMILNRWFVQRSSRTDRRRFWRCYVRRRLGWALTRQEEQHRAREVENRTWESCLRFWRHRDRRCRGTNRYFHRLRGRNNKGWATRDLPPCVLSRLLADPEAPLRQKGCSLLKDSPSSTVAELRLSLLGEPKPVVYKRFAVTRWISPWLSLARATRAFRSWVNGHRLLNCGVPTARPLAVIHHRAWGLTRECYLLSEKLPDTVTLHEYVAALAGLPAPVRRARVLQLLEQVARLVQALHRRQLSHRDLKAVNILISGNSGRSSRLYLIDLVGLERWRRLPRSRRVQNLSRLHASFHDHPWLSRTDKLRFLRTYLAWGLNGKSGWKEWWRQIAKGTQLKITLNQRRGRPLS